MSGSIADTIKQKLVKLSKMTIENGATEAEAMTAASKMAEILDAHGMTSEELKLYSTQSDENKKEKVEFGITGENRKKLHEVQFCAVGIAHYFDCKVIASTTYAGRVIKFFGFASDVSACIALTETLMRAMENDFKIYLGATDQTEVHGRTLRKAFMLGFGRRVTDRLYTMKKERTASKATGTSLIVLKNQIVEQSFNNLNIRLKQAGRTSYSNAEAYSAGVAAANRASLGPQTKKIA